MSVVPELFRHQPGLFPVLVDIQALDNEGRTKIQERESAWEQEADTLYVMALFDTTAQASALIAHLVRRMFVRRPDGVEDALRFYDPFVFRHLRWLLSAEQMDSLLGPIQNWYWREPDGMWHRQPRAADHASLRPLRLTTGQWPTLLRMSDIQQALAELSRADSIHSREPAIAQQLDMLLAEAWRTYGMADRQDRRLYAVQATRYHRDIHRHPVMQSCLRRISEEAMTFVTACSDFDDARMRRMAEELQQMQVSHQR